MSITSPLSSRKQRSATARWGRVLLLGLLALILVGYWRLPISGEVLVVSDDWQNTSGWPRVRLELRNPEPGRKTALTVTDTVPWSHVKLFVAGTEATFERDEEDARAGYWTWYWSFITPNDTGYELVFYHDCDTGCIERTRITIGAVAPEDSGGQSGLIPTKLGIVFANPERDWHNRSGWDVELTYARQAGEEYWGVDDLAGRVQRAVGKGLRVLVRVDYDQGQSLPPANDYLALDTYPNYLRRLARDARLKDVYGYSIGSGYNASGSNSQAPDSMVTPEWYARVFNGYNARPDHADNVVETIRAENPTVRVLVGPVRPWVNDQDGQLPYQIDVPWLNYMNTLVAELDAAAQANEAIGIPFAVPDGFALQAPGRIDAPELGASKRSDEPRIDLPRSAWDGAQAGFRVYRDWLDIVNAYPHTRGRPLFITSTNTFTPDTDVKPAENYPTGWLSTALEVVNQEPQVQALCWFLDIFPMDAQWELFSLTDPRGLLMDAADEFDRLLSSQP